MRTLAPTAAPIAPLDVILSAVETCVAARSQARLEDELKAYLNVNQVFLVSSGQTALTLTLQALHTLRSARRVVIPAYTCFSVPAAIVRAGLEPVVADIDPATFDFDEHSLVHALNHPDVLCVVPTHLFGIPADVARVRRLARRDVFVVEDAAQGLGLTASDGRMLGSLGDVSVFSLSRGKHLTCGGGGFIAANTPQIERACRDLCAALPRAGARRALRSWLALGLMAAFTDPRLYWVPAGLPFLRLGETRYVPDFAMTRLEATAAGALRRWRTRLQTSNRDRQAAVGGWQRELGLPASETHRRPLLRFPMMLPSPDARARLVAASRAHGLGLSTMYPTAIHQIPELRARFAGQRFPGAEAVAARLVTLPTHQHVRPEDRAALRAAWPRDIAGTEPLRERREVHA